MGLYDYYTGPTLEGIARMRAAGLRGTPFNPAEDAPGGLPATPPLAYAPEPGQEAARALAGHSMGGATGSWGEPEPQPGPAAPQQTPPQAAVPPQAPPPPQPRALKRAVGQANTSSTSTSSVPVTPPPEKAGQGQPGGQETPEPESASAALQRRADALTHQLDALEGPVDYSALKPEMQRRQGEGRSALIMALAAQNAGKGFEPFSAQYLKRASELQANMPVEGGYINDQGEAVIDPGYKKIQQVQYMQRRLTALDNAIANAQSREEKIAYQKQRDKESDVLKREQMNMQRMFHNMTATIAQQGLDLRRDMARAQGLLPGGEGGAQIDVLPKNATNEEKTHYANAAEIVNLIPSLQEDVKAHPNAFGARQGLAENIGGRMNIGAQDVPFVGKKLTPEEATVRGRVFTRFSKVMHDLIGSAQTEQERINLRSFVPAPGESAESIANKMNAALAEAQAVRGGLRKRYGLGGNASNQGTRDNPVQVDY